MPKLEVTTDSIRKPVGVFSQATVLDHVCRVDVYVRNMEHFQAIHDVRKQYFKPPLPASTMVEVTKMVSPDYLIEINAIAVIPSK